MLIATETPPGMAADPVAVPLIAPVRLPPGRRHRSISMPCVADATAAAGAGSLSRHLAHQRPQTFARRVGGQGRPRSGCSLSTEADDVGDGLPPDRADAAGEHLPQHYPERPDVGAPVDSLAPGLFRGSCRPRCRERPPSAYGAERQPASRHRVSTTGVALASPKSRTFTVRRRELDVGGLEVAVDDAPFVRRLERVGDLGGEELHGHVENQGPAGKALGQSLALDELHDDEERESTAVRRRGSSRDPSTRRLALLGASVGMTFGQGRRGRPWPA